MQIITCGGVRAPPFFNRLIFLRGSRHAFQFEDLLLGLVGHEADVIQILPVEVMTLCHLSSSSL